MSILKKLHFCSYLVIFKHFDAVWAHVRYMYMYMHMHMYMYMYMYIYIYVQCRKVLGGSLGPFWGVNFFKKLYIFKSENGLNRPLVWVGLWGWAWLPSRSLWEAAGKPLGGLWGASGMPLGAYESL